MSRKPVCGAVGVMAIAIVSCAKAPTNPQPEFSAERFKAHVTFLADDLLEGRETVPGGTRLPHATLPVSSRFWRCPRRVGWRLLRDR